MRTLAFSLLVLVTASVGCTDAALADPPTAEPLELNTPVVEPCIDDEPCTVGEEICDVPQAWRPQIITMEPVGSVILVETEIKNGRSLPIGETILDVYRMTVGDIEYIVQISTFVPYERESPALWGDPI